MNDQHFVQNFVAERNPRSLAVLLGITLALVGAVLGLLLAFIGPLYTVVLVIALAAAIWAMLYLENALYAIVAVIALLPFATLPVKIVLTPTFLDLAMAAALFLYAVQWMTRERRRLATTPIHPLMVLFMVLSVFSFVAGLRYAGMTSNVVRKFAEFLLSMGFALLLVDILRTEAQVRRFALVLVITGAAAAALGIVLWVMPDQMAEQILGRLAIIGYPNAGIIQYIESNPELSERAISTSVNPNSLGGLLVMIAALTVPQLMTRYPITGKRWHAAPILAVLVGCLVLTFSRGSMVAFAVALIFIAALRYRKALAVLVIIGLVLLILPWSQTYLERFITGFQGEDLAMQMRFGEYKDAFTLIGRYPLLGVGFSGAPDIDIYLGVSSVYLILLENMGLLGMGGFVILMASLFFYAWLAHAKLDQLPSLHSIWLGLCAALIGALVNGIVDHYFFNLEFHHAVTIFWLFVGTLLATSRIALQAQSLENRHMA